MADLLKLLWREQTGQDLTEYALLLALLALGAITSIGTLAKMINTFLRTLHRISALQPVLRSEQRFGSK
jgi:Flp pilus assembly pilin Flp